VFVNLLRERAEHKSHKSAPFPPPTKYKPPCHYFRLLVVVEITSFELVNTLCRVEQFAGGSSSRRQSTLF